MGGSCLLSSFDCPNSAVEREPRTGWVEGCVCSLAFHSQSADTPKYVAQACAVHSVSIAMLRVGACLCEPSGEAEQLLNAPLSASCAAAPRVVFVDSAHQQLMKFVEYHTVETSPPPPLDLPAECFLSPN